MSHPFPIACDHQWDAYNESLEIITFTKPLIYKNDLKKLSHYGQLRIMGRTANAINLRNLLTITANLVVLDSCNSMNLFIDCLHEWW